ncbi:thiolase C-terminal domain-containing protein [Pseudonocardia kunmingensis]|uniref:Acetyl-CoA acetyltransferase n=1 Tax=Pseudonocardia kunmingensis TaxID=630975 RepID=A0A543DPG6_9PSEU|nr:thiolase [Pseudonocardia kunmingensis]TQM11226.1 acetyl-CoA acetyltransferase [Pseudonocardia kunmingensis]
MVLKDETAIVGVGSTPYYKRGMSLPQTKIELACKAILAACEDAGLSIKDVDGFAYYSGGFDTALIAQSLGIPEVKFTATLTGGGGGAAGSIGLAAAAITSGHANVVVSLMTLQQVPTARFGAAFATKGTGGYSRPVNPETDFVAPSGLFAPGQMFSLLAQRHMHLYGTRREAFGEIAISQRENAANRPTARFRDRITMDDYLSARMISDPLCLFDYTQENDGAVATITTSAERATNLRQPPVYLVSAANGSAGRWGQSITWMGMPDEYFASSGHRTVAKDVYERAGVTAADIDVALLYDHFTPMVLMQVEDYGFCEIGEGGPFVESGAIRWKTGSIPVNTHGGNLSEAYIIGMTHVKEAVEQLRGQAVNQVEGAELALVTGGPAPTPTSAIILRK